MLPDFFFFVLHFLHALFHADSISNACNPLHHTGVALTPLARILMLMSGWSLVCEGILLGLLSTLSFINLINDVYWGKLHVNEHLCKDGLSARCASPANSCPATQLLSERLHKKIK